MAHRIVSCALLACTFWTLSTNAAAGRAAAHHARGCNTHRCDRKAARHWAQRHPMQRSLASWFSPADSGGTPACGLGWDGSSSLGYGVANKTLPCGQRIRMCASRCVTVRVADRGPFVAGRDFDLMPGAKRGLGCGDLCVVRWRAIR